MIEARLNGISAYHETLTYAEMDPGVMRTNVDQLLNHVKELRLLLEEARPILEMGVTERGYQSADEAILARIDAALS